MGAGRGEEGLGERQDKSEEREINKTEENRSINISAAAPFTDFFPEP